MPLVHYAYTFDPGHFHKEVAERCIAENRLSLDKLLKAAREVVAEAPVVTQEILRRLRFDREWLDPHDRDVFPADLYVIILAKQLSPSPSLSNRLHSYAILERVLPLAGWSNDQIRVLIRGKMLHLLLEQSANPNLIAEVSDLDQYGGWIDLATARQLLSELQVAKPRFLTPGEAELQAIHAISDLSAYQQRSATEVLQDAYADAEEMLRVPIAGTTALFIIFD